MRSVIVVFLLGLIHGVAAQDITGIWRGHFSDNNRMNQILNIDDRYRFEVQIAQTDKKLQAITYSYKNIEFYAKASATGSINPKTGKVRVLELKIIEVRKGMNTMVCSMDCMLTWTKSGDDEFLEGTFVATNTLDSSFCGRGTVFLRKEAVSDFYKEPFVARKEKEIAKKLAAANTVPKPVDSLKIAPAPVAKTKPAPVAKTTPKPPANTTPKKPAPKSSAPVAKTAPQKKPETKLTPQQIEPLARPDTPKKTITVSPGKSFSASIPSVIKNRENEITKTITVKSNEVALYIYDNGTIDHDTVSVYLDNKLVVSRKMLSLEPIIVKIKLDTTNNYHEVVMVAENLGDIPPNTSLMVVKAGDQQYEVRITSTEQKNAVVVFKYAGD
ncbi:hypothetical protein [Pinibacter aurantiacus]|uniref:Uncharacterized protein n=1 Tax=Pinibacter aurantiacus TaxID=2851599 RepID=A0A9E2W3A9_9BACT|nr:hypothetical protein [Pinibacter aurantiacus]MBV4356043.1 hypothetical protein [Pinibacter aurantiacus]